MPAAAAGREERQQRGEVPGAAGAGEQDAHCATLPLRRDGAPHRVHEGPVAPVPVRPAPGRRRPRRARRRFATTGSAGARARCRTTSRTSSSSAARARARRLGRPRRRRAVPRRHGDRRAAAPARARRAREILGASVEQLNQAEVLTRAVCDLSLHDRADPAALRAAAGARRWSPAVTPDALLRSFAGLREGGERWAALEAGGTLHLTWTQA